MKSFIVQKINGFTLAEVLITLAILGILAAIVLPGLINNTNKQEYVSKLKKEYSILSQAYLEIKADNGGEMTTALSSCSDHSHPCLKDLFKTKLKYIKDCDTNKDTNLNVCFPQQTDISFLNGVASDGNYINNNETAGLTLTDGTSLAFFLDKADCTYNDPNGTKRCGWVVVDVNGLKKPNQWGKDLYLIMILPDIIRPATPDITEGSRSDCTTNGITCASQYLFGK